MSVSPKPTAEAGRSIAKSNSLGIDSRIRDLGRFA